MDWLARSCGGLAVDCLTMYGRPKWSTSLRCIHPCHSLHGYSSHYSFIFSHSLLRVGGTGTINASSSLVYFCFSWILCFGVVHLYPSCSHKKEKQKIQKKKKLHRPGIEPGPPAWQARILPLNHRCLLKYGLFIKY